MSLTDRLAQMEAAFANLAQQVNQHEQQLSPVRDAPLVNQKSADQRYGPAAMRKQLGAKGSAPLDLSSLKGAAAESQNARAPELETIPELGDPAYKQGDFITVKEVTYRRDAAKWTPISGGASSQTSTGLQLFSGAPSPVPPSSGSFILSGSFESRPASASEGTIWIETSRSTVDSTAPFPIYQFRSGAWALISGMFYRAQGDLATLSATLGTGDAGAVVYVGSPYCHRLKWSGSAWDWADPADASGRYAWWPNPAPPDGWHLADGSTVSRLNADGTVTAGVVLVDTVGNPVYLKTGAFTGAVVPEQAPSFAGSAMVAHQHAVPYSTESGDSDFDIAPQAFGAAASTINTTKHIPALVPATETLHPDLTSAVSAGTPSGTISLAAGDPVAHLDSPLYYRL